MAVWKPVTVKVTLLPDGSPRYEVSNTGEVRIADEWSEYYGCRLRQHNTFGEPCVWLNPGVGHGVGRIYRVRELVEAAFGGEPVAEKKQRRKRTPRAKKPVEKDVSPNRTWSAFEPTAVVEEVTKSEQAAVPKMDNMPEESGFGAENTTSVPVDAPEEPDTWNEAPKMGDMPEESVQLTSVAANEASKMEEMAEPDSTSENAPSSMTEVAEAEKPVKRSRKAKRETDGRHALRKPVRQYTKSGILIKEHGSLKEAAADSGVAYSTISACCHQRIKSAGGFVWKYVVK